MRRTERKRNGDARGSAAVALPLRRGGGSGPSGPLEARDGSVVLLVVAVGDLFFFVVVEVENGVGARAGCFAQTTFFLRERFASESASRGFKCQFFSSESSKNINDLYDVN